MEQENKQDLFQQFTIDHTGRQYLRTTIGWARTIAFTSVGGYIISIIGMIIGPQKVPQRYEGFDVGIPMNGSDLTTTMISIAVGLVLCFFLYRFYAQTRKALDELNQPALINGFANLKYYFITLSVFLIIIFVVILLAVVALGARSLA